MSRTALLAALAAAGCGAARPELPFYRSAALVPEWLPAREAEAPAMHRVAAFRMVDQYDRVVTERSLAGKVTVAHFFFTRCRDVCPMTTGNLKRLLDSLPGEDRIQVLSYSVVPAGDSVPALAEFARTHRLTDPRWHLLTGNPAAVARLARESYFVRLGDGAGYGVAAIAHTESLVLVDGNGRLRGVYAGTLPLELQRLREDIGALLRRRS